MPECGVRVWVAVEGGVWDWVRAKLKVRRGGG